MVETAKANNLAPIDYIQFLLKTCWTWIIPKEIKKAVAEKPENVIFAGFMPPVILRDAYCGADAFAFFSYEETEGIVVLEALSCEIPVIVRDIPVYEKWLEDGVQVRKATDPFSY